MLVVTAAVADHRPPRELGPCASIEQRTFALAMMVAWLLTLRFWVASP